MKHQMKSRYPAPSSVVIKMFADPKFHTEKLDSLGYAGKYAVLAQNNDGKEFNIKIERKLPIAIPGLGKGGESAVTNDEIWTLASKAGRVKVELKGMPLEMSCVMQMKDEGGECVITYDWDVKAKVPLVGGAIEKFVVADMEKKAAEETAAGIKLLKNYN